MFDDVLTWNLRILGAGVSQSLQIRAKSIPKVSAT
jgi:hypothetical protein